MATARPLTIAPHLATLVAAPEAEAAWRRMVDAQCADLAFLRERWPDHTSAEVEACHRRLLAREAPGGEAEQALAQLDDAYGGPDLVPPEVRRRWEAYVEARFARPPWAGGAG